MCTLIKWFCIWSGRNYWLDLYKICARQRFSKTTRYSSKLAIEIIANRSQGNQPNKSNLECSSLTTRAVSSYFLNFVGRCRGRQQISTRVHEKGSSTNAIYILITKLLCRSWRSERIGHSLYARTSIDLDSKYRNVECILTSGLTPLCSAITSNILSANRIIGQCYWGDQSL